MLIAYAAFFAFLYAVTAYLLYQNAPEGSNFIFVSAGAILTSVIPGVVLLNIAEMALNSFG